MFFLASSSSSRDTCTQATQYTVSIPTHLHTGNTASYPHTCTESRCHGNTCTQATQSVPSQLPTHLHSQDVMAIPAQSLYTETPAHSQQSTLSLSQHVTETTAHSQYAETPAQSTQHTETPAHSQYTETPAPTQHSTLGHLHIVNTAH